MQEELEQMVDSSACFYRGLVRAVEEQGRGRLCLDPRSTEYVSLASWYGNQFEGDCPFGLYRWRN